jgi:hypothetical protein
MASRRAINRPRSKNISSIQEWQGVAKVMFCEVMVEVPHGYAPKLQEGIECRFVSRRENEKDSRHG